FANAKKYPNKRITMAEMFKRKEDTGEKIAFSKNQKGMQGFQKAVQNLRKNVVAALKSCFPKKA
ncbi:MAG TPA: hypothetical protein PLO51_05870, partial [Candidatus Micrarchaeota archaeon]|nr:hypothetical protein [Candidatus Micrarchaeota archaeon]